MRIELKANQQGQIYLPKLLRNQWGNEYVLIPNETGGYIYPKNASTKDALKSLQVVEKAMEVLKQREEVK
jgi:hypothetical protein